MAFFEEVLSSFSSCLAMTEVRSPPCSARQVRPPVVRPVRKMIKRLVLCMVRYILAVLSRNELVTTETEEKAMAAPAIAGFRIIPKSG